MRKLFVIAAAAAIVFQGAALAVTGQNTKAKSGSYSESGWIANGSYTQDEPDASTVGPIFTVDADVVQRFSAVASDFHLTFNLGKLSTAIGTAALENTFQATTYNNIGGNAIPMAWGFKLDNGNCGTPTVGADNVAVFAQGMKNSNGSESFPLKIAAKWNAASANAGFFRADGTYVLWYVPTNRTENTIEVTTTLEPGQYQAPGAYHFDPTFVSQPAL